MVLTLFLFYEMTLGVKSYWFPYLRLMPDVDFSASWDDTDLMLFEDSLLFFHMKKRHQVIQNRWIQFKEILMKYPDIFPQKLIDEGLFLNLYSQVCTRCFGYGLPTTSMIPMADNLNHNSLDVTHEIINTCEHLKGPENQDYFKM